MRKRFLLIILSLVVFSSCTSIEHLNYFYMRGLHTTTFLPRPVDTIPVPHARVSGGIQYSRINILEYYDDKHPPVDSSHSSSYKSPDIHWRKPPLLGSFSADFGPFAKIVSVCTQTDGAVMDYEFFINFKVGPSVQYSTNHLGIRGDFIFSIGNFYYSYEVIRPAFLFSGPYKDSEPNSAGTTIGFSPNLTVNTLQEHLFMNYYIQAGYQVQLLFLSTFVKLPYATLNLGVYKNISNWQLLGGARFAFVTKFNYYDKPQTPVFPTFIFNISYNVNLKKNKDKLL